MRGSVAAGLALVCLLLSACRTVGVVANQPKQQQPVPSVEASALAGDETTPSVAAVRPPTAHYAVGSKQHEVDQAVRKYVRATAPDIEVASVDDIRIARASDGTYWASAWVTPVDVKDVDTAIVFLHKVGSVWRIKDFGTGIDGSDLPKSVRAKLWPD